MTPKITPQAKARQLTQKTLVIASHNLGKIQEIEDLLTPFRLPPHALEVTNARTLNLPEPIETETTYQGNARLKAHAIARLSGFPALADDSGFEVAAIDNAPGIYSARWAKIDAAKTNHSTDAKNTKKDFNKAMHKIHALMVDSGRDTKKCRFVCALSLAWPDGHDETVEAHIDGEFVWPPRGQNGFGYDPVFRLQGSDQTSDQTFGEADPHWKQSVSHRKKAFDKLLARCFAQTPKKHAPQKHAPRKHP